MMIKKCAKNKNKKLMVIIKYKLLNNYMIL